MDRDDSAHQYQPPLPFLSALDSQESNALHGVSYLCSI